jgi:hypothetical protein
MSIRELKSMTDKAEEAIKLIKQIRDLGILQSDPSYLEVKTHLNEWIKSDEKSIKEYTIEFPRYGRKAVLTLPWRSDQTCSFFLKKPFGS